MEIMVRTYLSIEEQTNEQVLFAALRLFEASGDLAMSYARVWAAY